MRPPRRFEITERPDIPLDGFVLGWIAMVPLLVCAVVSFHSERSGMAIEAGRFWAAALSIFLAGVRRGLSFRTVGGPKPRQIAMMLWLFCGGVVAVVLPARPSLGLLILLYLSLAIVDPKVARAGDVPLYFRRLRPAQMGAALLCLGVMLWQSTFADAAHGAVSHFRFEEFLVAWGGLEPPT